MSFKAKLILWGALAVAIIAMVCGAVYKVDKIFDTLKEQADEITRLNGENTKLSDQKDYLTLQLKEMTENKAQVDKINADLKVKEKERDVEFDVLQDELRLARLKQKNQPSNTDQPSTEPEVPDTLEVDVAWRAYCKALPGGCVPGVTQ